MKLVYSNKEIRITKQNLLISNVSQFESDCIIIKSEWVSSLSRKTFLADEDWFSRENKKWHRLVETNPNTARFKKDYGKGLAERKTLRLTFDGEINTKCGSNVIYSIYYIAYVLKKKRKQWLERFTVEQPSRCNGNKFFLGFW